jgi:hypothetical protein
LEEAYKAGANDAIKAVSLDLDWYSKSEVLPDREITAKYITPGKAVAADWDMAVAEQRKRIKNFLESME